MEKAVKSLMGYSIAKGDKPATHVILTLEEYDKILEDTQNAMLKAENIKEKAIAKISEYQNKYQKDLKQAINDSNSKINALATKIIAKEQEIDNLNKLNSNLLRISRERANAKRGLKPKKQHNGYIVLNNQQCEYTIRQIGAYRKVKIIHVLCWKVQLQTPYDSSLPFDAIRNQISNDFHNFIFKDLKISKCLTNTDDIEDYLLRETYTNNMFKASFKANFKSGFWELNFLTKECIDIPEEMTLKI